MNLKSEEGWKKPKCPKCNSGNLKIKAEVIGEGLYRRMHRKLVCVDCQNVLAIL